MATKEKRPGKGDTSVALTRVAEPALAPIRPVEVLNGLESAFLAFLQSKVPGPVVPVERRVFLTVVEAAEFSGLPVAFLRRLIASEKLKAIKTGAGWRIARAELETLAGTLTNNTQQLTEQQLRDMDLNQRRRRGL